jgi:hypothetical protein
MRNRISKWICFLFPTQKAKWIWFVLQKSNGIKPFGFVKQQQRELWTMTLGFGGVMTMTLVVTSMMALGFGSVCGLHLGSRVAVHCPRGGRVS